MLGSEANDSFPELIWGKGCSVIWPTQNLLLSALHYKRQWNGIHRTVA